MKGVVRTSSFVEFPLRFEFATMRERATWVYGILRSILAVPVSQRTAVVAQFTSSIDENSHREEIRDAFRQFWSHHSYRMRFFYCANCSFVQRRGLCRKTRCAAICMFCSIP